MTKLKTCVVAFLQLGFTWKLVDLLSQTVLTFELKCFFYGD